MILPLSPRARGRFPDLLRLGEASPAELRILAFELSRPQALGERITAGSLAALTALSEDMAERVAGSEKEIAERLSELEQHDREDLRNLLVLAGKLLLEEGTEESADPAATTQQLVLLWWLCRDPALAAFRQLFDESMFLETPVYRKLASGLCELINAAGAAPLSPEDEATEHSTSAEPERADREAADHRPSAPPQNEDTTTSLLETLEQRSRQSTGSRGQEAAARAPLRILRARDLLLEEQPRLPPGPPRAEPPPAIPPPGLVPPREEPPPQPRAQWMRELTLVAKHTLVWMHQLSERFGRPIRRLDEIPNAAFAELAEQGFSGVWLFGVWQRSPASRRIKRFCGSQNAVSSAYSVFDYRVAGDLGGDPAMDKMKERARVEGLRIGVDVVPNHFGLDSAWTRRHPEYFLEVEDPPYLNYRFDGPDLSRHPQIGLFLERHYYDQSDAAVVFKRIDRRTGKEQFFYHGNDGTGTPWNDTAQLDYTRRDTRAAMVETIVQLAQRFDILRFDAAMTLTKYHYQRLWFPEPGSGGAIPSRSEHGLSKEQFEGRMEHEFWLEVGHAVSARAPDTLLMAEAFWLMEPFFIQSLGMHRVYNSAFMHFVRDGNTGGLRKMLSEPLERDPLVLDRYTNFLSNPDEPSAREQLGNSDRYFGACSVLATLPGLPLFAHGQAEGLQEKYGMDFDRPLLDEQPDAAVLDRHEREIAPLLELRGLFSDASKFQLLAYEQAGSVHSRVLCFASSSVLVVFNHCHEPARGSLRLPSSFASGQSFFEIRDDQRYDAQQGQLDLPLQPWQCLVLRTR